MKQDQAAVEAAVRTMVATILEKPEDKIGPQADFVDQLGADSMAALELMAEIEKRYGIVVPPENLPRFKSVASVSRLVMELLEAEVA